MIILVRKLIFGGFVIVLYIVFSYQYLNNLLIKVEKSEQDILIVYDRQQFLLGSKANIVYEISKYNSMDLDNLETNVEIKLIKNEILELNKRVDELSVELTGCANRLTIGRTRLSESVENYNKARGFLLFYPIVKGFGFVEIKQGGGSSRHW